jgi:hypothetical protein
MGKQECSTVADEIEEEEAKATADQIPAEDVVVAEAEHAEDVALAEAEPAEDVAVAEAEPTEDGMCTRTKEVDEDD